MGSGGKCIEGGTAPRAVLLLLALVSVLSAEDIRFNRDIRPILSENCFFCHGQDPKHREAKLRLDIRAEALMEHDSGFAIVPGHPEKSEILKRLLSHDADDQMPPPESNRKVSPAQIELIRRWIAQGAPYEKHWSFVPPEKAPAPKLSDASLARQPFDRYVLAKLEAEKLLPSAEAKPTTWLRPAAHTGRDCGLRVRCLPARRSRLCRRGGPSALVTALRRTPRPGLARRRPLRRHPRLQ